ncbi:ribonucleoside-diphosphate reductase, adenosylcobalamin-dependent, partial [Patescibacteria group bacterium]
VCYSLGVRYGSEEAQDLAAQIMEFIRFYSMKTSIELAKERGSFPAIEGSIYDPSNITWIPPQSLKPFKHDFGRPFISWQEITDGIRINGIRNAAITTIAPTGTISTVAGVEGYGCEPVFALAYYRNVYQAAGQQERITLTYVSPSFQKALDKMDLPEDKKKEIIEEVITKGTCQNIDSLPEHIKNTFVVSADINPEEHILMQANLQAFVDNSISKTCNFPSNATREDVAKVFMMGWKLGCKGLTVYVIGSREEVVLETKETVAIRNGKEISDSVSEEKEDSIEEGGVVLKRPYKLTGSTYRVQTPQGVAFITINRTEHGRPFEVFINIGKAGTDVAALAEALGRLVSGWLRVPSSSSETVTEIISQLYGIGGSRSVGFGKNKVSSIPEAVAKVLAEDLGHSLPKNGNDHDHEDEEIEKNNSNSAFSQTDMCPDCGNYSLVQEEGCAKCYNCGFSVC